MQALSSKRVNARKQYRCDLCGKVIRPGEGHMRKAIKYYDTVYTRRECDRCEPYVREMLSGWDDDTYDGDELLMYMCDNHPAIYDQWLLDEPIKWGE